MDFLDPKKKRAHEIRLFIGYGLMAVALLFGTFILVFAANGFDLDRKTGNIIQNGLVYVDSHPVKGTVYINGQKKGDTDTRLVLPAGPYELELKREGYRSWKRKFDLIGSTIERYVYPFLWPEKLEPSEVATFASAPPLATQSPDRRWLVIQQPGALASFSLADLNRENFQLTSFSVPADILSQGPGVNQLELVEWSTDNRHLLLRHKFEGGVNYVIVDREEPASSININKIFPASSFNAVRLRDKKFDQLYLHNTTDGGLNTAEVRTRIISPLLNKVLAFQPHGDNMVLYVSGESATPGKAVVRMREGLTTYNIRELPVASTYLIDLARFENRWYMAIGTNNDPRVYLYKDVFDELKASPEAAPKPFSVLRLDNPEFLTFSANTRFIGVQSGSRFAVYDADTNRSYRYDTGLQFTPGQKAAWMDGHRYATVSAGKMVVFDFDGTNSQTLLSASPAYLPFFARDYQVLYTLGPSLIKPAETSVSRTELRLQQDR